MEVAPLATPEPDEDQPKVQPKAQKNGKEEGQLAAKRAAPWSHKYFKRGVWKISVN